MKILILTSRIPYPPHKGDQLRAYYQIKYLSKHHEIILLSLIATEEEREYVVELEKYCERIELVLLEPVKSILNVLFYSLSSMPAQVVYFYSKKMHKKLAQVLNEEKIDIVLTQMIRMSNYTKKLNYTKALDLIDSVSVGLKRRVKTKFKLSWFFYFIEWLKVKQYEKLVMPKYNICFIVSEADKKTLPVQGNVLVVPNGVELNHNQKDYSNLSRFQKSNQEINLIFTGNMGYYPNIEAVKYFSLSVMPNLLKKGLNAKFTIAGKNPAKSVRELANENVKVTGFVENIFDEINKADIYVAPLQEGAGLQNKILEAFAVTIPVIMTSVAQQGIGYRPVNYALIADTPEEFVQCIEKFVNYPELRVQFAENAYKLVRDEFDWDTIIKKMDANFRRLI